MTKTTSESTAFKPDQGQIRIFSAFQLLFQSSVGQGCFFIPVKGPENWTLVFPPKHYLEPYHFEIYFGKFASRDAYLRKIYGQLSRDKRPVITRYGDFTEFFCPYLVGGRCEGFLNAGPMLDRCPSPETLRQHWKRLTGALGSDLDPDFLHYVRTTLDTPIMDREGLEGYSRLLELFARWLAGAEIPGIIPELDRLRVKVFARRLPHPYWVDWAIGIDKFFSKPEKGYVLQDWARDELGINRMPTVVAALMPRKPGVMAGTLDTLCLARNFQYECYRAAQEIPETTSRPLGNYGMTVLTSAKPGLSATQARLEVREKVQVLCRVLDRRLGAKVLAGIGTIIPGGENLAKSFREAVISLNKAVQEGRTIAFSEGTSLQREILSSSEMRDLLKGFSESLALSSPGRLVLARERFINQLLYNGYGPETSRAYMLSVLNMLMESFEKRSGMPPAAAGHLGKELINRLDATHTLPDLVASFRAVVDTLLRLQDKPREASVTARLNSIIGEIRRDPAHAWRLSKLSKQAGLSNPTFLKWFQKLSGLQFGVYIRQARLSKAKDLLREGHLNLERIAQECGFSSSSSFIQVFRRALGTSPGRFRQKNEND